MRGPYPYQLLPKYPHLSEAESLIWNRFVSKFPDAFSLCYYDVEVGQCRPCEDKLSPSVEADRQYLGKYKIDVIGETEAHYCIIEVKKEATTKAMGEIWLYEKLFKEAWKPSKPVLLYIVTDTEMPNIRTVCEAEGVQVYVV